MNISILNTENNQLSSPNNMLNIQNISDQYYYIVTHDNGLKSVLTSFERPLFEKLVQRIGYPAEWIEHGEHCAVPIDGMQYETFRPRGIQMDSGIDVHQTDELIDCSEGVYEQADTFNTWDVVSIHEALRKLQGSGFIPELNCGNFYVECSSNKMLVKLKDKPDDTIVAGFVWVASCAEDDDGSYSYVVLVKPVNGSMSSFGLKASKIDTDVLLEELNDRGIVVFNKPKVKRMVNTQCAQALKLHKLYTVHHLGWFTSPTSVRGFNTGTQIITSQPYFEGIYADDNMMPLLQQSNTLEQWNSRVLSPVKHLPLALSMLCIGLSGLIAPYTGSKSFIFHLFGKGGRGKTIILEVVATLFGDPEEFMLDHNNSDTALELMAAKYSNLVLLLDEIGKNKRAGFHESIYDLHSGKGRSVATSKRTLVKKNKWNVPILSTGEYSMRVEGGKTRHLKNGELDRFLDIDVRDKAFDTKILRTVTRRLKDYCTLYYGQPAVRFIRGFINDEFAEGELKRLVMDYEDVLTPEHIEDGAKRIYSAIAAGQVAGELAVKYGVFDCTVEEIRTAMKFLADYALSHHLKCLQQVMDIIKMAYHDQKISGELRKNAKADVLVFHEKKQREVVVFIKAKVFENAIDESEREPMLQEMHERNWLIRTDTVRNKSFFCNKELEGYCFSLEALKTSFKEPEIWALMDSKLSLESAESNAGSVGSNPNASLKKSFNIFEDEDDAA